MGSSVTFVEHLREFTLVYIALSGRSHEVITEVLRAQF